MTSKTALNRCGDHLREWWAADEEITPEQSTCIDTVWAWRASHSVVLTSVVMSVRSFMTSEGVPVIVGQRLKRLPTIIDKLSREAEMQLSRMHDVGGCRAVLPPGRLDVVAGIRKRLDRSTNRVVRVYDYNEHPKPSGYRAVHVVVERLDRLVEIQIRTEGQQRWGDSVERLQTKLGVALKDGQGPADLLRYYTLVGHALACPGSRTADG